MEKNTTSSELEENTQNKRYNYLVGIDFGTYSTSFSFTHVDREGDIQTITDWKQTIKGEFGGRVASSIIYKQEESVPLWGGSAHKNFYNENSDFFYAPHIKLYLTDAENQTALPGNLSPVKLVSDYLKQLNEYGIDQMKAYFQGVNQENEIESVEITSRESSLNKEIYNTNFNVTKDQIRYFFSYPDSQDRRYTDILKRALEMAGIIGSSDPGHRLKFIPESRATAYFCSNTYDQALKPSRIPYLVCDIGGEELGLSTIIVEEISETGVIDTHVNQAAVGCGNLRLDKNMREYLEQKITAPENTFTLELLRRQLFDFFVNEIKSFFSNEDINNGGYIYNVDSFDITDSAIQSDYLQDNAFAFPYEDIKKYIFDPVTDTILECIEKAIQNSEKGISGIFLSGAIGQDKYLNNLVEEKFCNADVKIHSIRDRAFVVSKGLIYYGIRERALMIPYIEKRDVKQKNKIRKPGNEQQLVFTPSTFDDTKKFNHKNIDYIIGLDFGTTYSGFAYAPVPKNDEERKKTHIQLIKEIKAWPKQTNGNYPKVPSLLYYNQRMEYLKKFGSEAKAENARRNAKGLLLRNFKLLLSRDFNLDIDAKELKKLDDLNLVDAIANYLRDFSKEGINRMKRNNLTVDEARLGFIVTIPAMWSDEAKNTMREAVKKSGLVKSNNSRDSFDERVVFITEAEAAALYFERFYNDKFNMDRQQRFMICDAGGGTVDLLTFEIKREDNSGAKNIYEVTSGDGDNCGSVYLDENFKAYIVKKFSDTGIKFTEKGMESIVDQFIREIKPNFCSSLNPDIEEATRFGIPLSFKYPDDFEDGTGFIQSGQIVIQYTEMENIVFKPVVDKVLNLIYRQLLKLPEGERLLDTIAIVGGFGQSPYLHSKIKERFENKAVGALFIERLLYGHLATCKGAVSFGLKPRMASDGITRYTYGLQVKDKYRSQDDPLQKIIGYDGADYCQNVLTEIVAKETKISKGTVYILKTFVIYPNDPIFAIYSTDEKKHDSNLRKLINTDNIQLIYKLHVKIPEMPGINDGDKVMFDVVVEFTGTNINVDILHEGVLLTNEVVTKVNAIVSKKKYQLGTKGEMRKKKSFISIIFRSNS